MFTTNSNIQRYQQLQSLLVSSLDYNYDTFDLNELIGEFINFDNEGYLFIRIFPVSGDFVYFSDIDGKDCREVPLQNLSDKVIEQLFRYMTKAFLINEIKERL